MANKCERGYEVSMTIPSLKMTRSVVFTQRAKAKQFKAKWPGAKLQVVALCDGVIKRRGRRSF